jgi:hypothetical protein
LDVLQALQRFYDNNPEQLAQQLQKLMGHLRRTTVLNPAKMLNLNLIEPGLQVCTAV